MDYNIINIILIRSRVIYINNKGTVIVVMIYYNNYMTINHENSYYNITDIHRTKAIVVIWIRYPSNYSSKL